MKYILLLFMLCTIVQSQEDEKIDKAIAVVKNDEGKVLISKYYENARIESPHKIKIYTKVKDVPVGDLEPLPEEGYIEKDKIYVIDGTAYIAKEDYDKKATDDDLMSLFDTETEKEKDDKEQAIKDSLKALEDSVKVK